MKIYLTADLHFDHNNICGPDGFVSTRKHFDTVEQMNNTIILAHNNKIKAEDTTYIIGDVSLQKPKIIFDYLSELNGQIVLIKGNHDKQKTLKYLNNNNFKLNDGRNKFVTHEVGCRLKQNKIVYYLTHYPLQLGRRENLRNFCGHIHDYESRFSNSLNIGIDSPELPKNHKFGEPLLFDVAIKLLEDKIKRYGDRYTLDNEYYIRDIPEYYI